MLIKNFAFEAFLAQMKRSRSRWLRLRNAPLWPRRSSICRDVALREAPSAKITEAKASDAPLQGCRPRKVSREARRARPQRQNDGNELSGSPTGQTQAQTFDDSSRRAPRAKITERARATARVCHCCRGSFGRCPESCFGKPNGPAPSAKITEASASEAPLRGCRGSFGRRPESFLGKPDGPDPSVKTTGIYEEL